MRKKSGWWTQLQKNEFPETKTNYGDSSAADYRPGHRSSRIGNIFADYKPDVPVEKNMVPVPKKGKLPLFNPEDEIVNCPLCRGRMRLKQIQFGRRKGTMFWGCRNFPKCKGKIGI